MSWWCHPVLAPPRPAATPLGTNSWLRPRMGMNRWWTLVHHEFWVVYGVWSNVHELTNFHKYALILIKFVKSRKQGFKLSVAFSMDSLPPLSLVGQPVGSNPLILIHTIGFMEMLAVVWNSRMTCMTKRFHYGGGTTDAKAGFLFFRSISFMEFPSYYFACWAIRQ